MERKKEKIKVEIPSKAIRIKHAACPNGHFLMNEEHKINGYPSIEVIAQYQGKKGALFLDPIYGSYTIISELDIPQGEIIHFSCPKCGVSFSAAGHICDECSAPLIALSLPHDGVVEACCRNGCHFHNLTLSDAEDLFSKLDDDHSLDSFL